MVQCCIKWPSQFIPHAMLEFFHHPCSHRVVEVMSNDRKAMGVVGATMWMCTTGFFAGGGGGGGNISVRQHFGNCIVC